MAIEPEAIRARLRQARLQAGLTQQEMADELGVHKRTVENYERIRVPWAALEDWARITGRTPEWLIGGDEPAEETQLGGLADRVGQLEDTIAALRAETLRLEALLGGHGVPVPDPQEHPVGGSDG